MSKGPKDKLFLKLVKPLQDELNQERDQDKLLTEQLEAITESLSSMTNELENRSKLSFAIHEQLWDLEVKDQPKQNDTRHHHPGGHCSAEQTCGHG